MVLRFLAGAAMAALVIACAGPTPAEAGIRKGSHVATSGHVHKVKKAKKSRKARMAAGCMRHCAIHAALSAKHGHRAHKGHHKVKWHGWVATSKGFAFYLDGARYKGGTPWGPAMAYNNWQSGFSPRAFWLLIDRDRY
jgi:hypothetical protein